MHYGALGTVSALVVLLWMAPAAGGGTGSGDSEQHARVFNWTTPDGGSYSVQVLGEVSFTEDDQTIAELSSGGCFTVREEAPGGLSELETCRLGTPSELVWKFTVNGEARPPVAGEAWLAERLVHLARRTGLGVEGRAASILRIDGLPGLEVELERLPRAWVQAVYLEEAARVVSATDDRARILGLALSLLRDDPVELAGFLDRSRTLYLSRDPLAASYLNAVGQVGRESEARDLLLATAREEGLREDLRVKIGSLAAAFPEGSYKLELLQGLAPALWGSPRSRSVYFAAVDSLRAGHYRETLLVDLAHREAAAEEVLREVLARIAEMPSGWRQERVLREVAEPYLAHPAVRPAYLELLGNAGIQPGDVSAASAKKEETKR